MGCDIHMYVEYTNREKYNKYNQDIKYSSPEEIKNIQKPYWYSFGGKFNPGRNYAMFGILCDGVRCSFAESFSAKGLPPLDELGFYSKIDAYMYITEDGKGENECTLEQAERWGNEIIKDNFGKTRYTSQPDWHSFSWLTTQEFAKAIKIHDKLDTFNIAIEYRAILAAMKMLEKGNNIARIVFWFDN